jgi:hypothetical protein
MEIKYYRKEYLERRKATAQSFWDEVVRLFNSGKSAKDIAAMFKNPTTGKNYTREHIYWILKQMRNL